MLKYTIVDNPRLYGQKDNTFCQYKEGGIMSLSFLLIKYSKAEWKLKIYIAELT